MATPESASDPDRLRELGKAYAELGEIVRPYRELAVHPRAGVRGARARTRRRGPRDGHLPRGGARAAGRPGRRAPRQTRGAPRPQGSRRGQGCHRRDPRRRRGGQEAALWAGDLFEMYRHLAERHRWKTDVIASSPSDLGGFKEVSLEVRGKDAYGRLKYEAGVHRVQRVPVTESQGRIHTSTATVAVMPEAEEVEVEIRPEDLQIDVYQLERSRRAVGQHDELRGAHRRTSPPASRSNARRSARSSRTRRRRCATSAPDCTRSRSTRRTRRRPRARAQLGTGERSEKIRTYNFPEGRVTDHRIKHTSHQLDDVLGRRSISSTGSSTSCSRPSAPRSWPTTTTRLMRPAEVARRGADYLRRHGVDAEQAAVESEALLQRILDIDRAGLFARVEGLTTAEAKAYGRALCRRCTGTPLQHLTGEQGFRRLVLEVPTGRVRASARDRGARGDRALRAVSAIDARSSSMSVPGPGRSRSRSPTSDPARTSSATDIASEAVALARCERDAVAPRRDGRPGRSVRAVPAELRGTVDLVCANPPYVPRRAPRRAPARRARRPGRSRVRRPERSYRRLFDDARSIGCDLVARSPSRSRTIAGGEVSDRGRVGGVRATSGSTPDLNGRERVVSGRRP